ncbi:MAG: PIN domain-containing protein [Acidobacteriaceae bacterium]|nr:PIN domain-containing protein [Acidobacteriaceae bacterium]
MNIYLDTCALNRLTDDRSQPRIREELEAIFGVLDAVSLGHIRWIASSAIKFELERKRNPVQRQAALDFLTFASEYVLPTEATFRRAQNLESLGYGAMDSLHLAIAEQAKVDALLTVDDRFLSRAARGEGNPTVPVLNPIDWLRRRRPWRLTR